MAAEEGPYVGIGAGFVSMNDAAVKGHDSMAYSPPLDAKSGGEGGFAVHGVAGYGFSNGLRIEGELGYRENDVEEMAVSQPGGLAALLPEAVRTSPGALATLRGRQAIDGDVSALTLMANLYYDIDAGAGWRPYVGGGIGLANLSVSAESSTGATLVDDEDTVFAYKISSGIGYEIGVDNERWEGRPIVVSLEYRYFGTEDPTFKGSLTGTKFDTEQDGHYVGLGLRFGF
jgi:opacity protein-like surface antigen